MSERHHDKETVAGVEQSPNEKLTGLLGSEFLQLSGHEAVGRNESRGECSQYDDDFIVGKIRPSGKLDRAVA